MMRNFAKPSIRDRVCKEIYAGDKSTVLCITEPWVGSDVAGMRTTVLLELIKHNLF